MEKRSRVHVTACCYAECIRGKPPRECQPGNTGGREEEEKAHTRNDLIVTQCKTAKKASPSGRGNWQSIVVLRDRFGSAFDLPCRK